MALLIFPSNPTDGQLYPVIPAVGQNQYQWSSVDNTWHLLGTATGVIAGVYCAADTFAPRLTIDAVGRITNAVCVELTGFVKNNNPTAFNNYVWPTGNGLANQFLVNDGAGNLTWSYGAFGQQPGLGLVIDGGQILKVSIPIASSPPVAGTAANQATPGSLYWDSDRGDLFIYYNDGTTSQWVSATSGMGSSFVQLNNNNAFNGYVWPNADGPVGGVLLTDGAGNLSWGTTSGVAAGNGLTQQGTAFKISVPAAAAPPAQGAGVGQATDGALYYDTGLGKMFYLYNDGVTTQWVQIG